LPVLSGQDFTELVPQSNKSALRKAWPHSLFCAARASPAMVRLYGNSQLKASTLTVGLGGYCQVRSVPSAPPEIRKPPALSNATASTGPWCPDKSLTCALSAKLKSLICTTEANGERRVAGSHSQNFDAAAKKSRKGGATR
jgi:hypothetical protein